MANCARTSSSTSGEKALKQANPVTKHAKIRNSFANGVLTI
jgi:hypothetical protein